MSVRSKQGTATSGLNPQDQTSQQRVKFSANGGFGAANSSRLERIFGRVNQADLIDLAAKDALGLNYGRQPSPLSGITLNSHSVVAGTNPDFPTGHTADPGNGLSPLAS